MRRIIITIATITALAGCEDEAGDPSRPDAGAQDAGARDAAMLDAGDASGLDASPGDAGVREGPPFALPIYRLGPRLAFGGGFSLEVSGRIALPSAAASAGDLDDLEVHGHGLPAGVPVQIETPRVEGDRLVADFRATVSFIADDPVRSREIFRAELPSLGARLFGLLGAGDVLHFDLESTARQALALSRIPEEGGLYAEEVSYFGLAEGDDLAIDHAVPTIAAELEAALIARAGSALAPTGFATPSSELFLLLDASVAGARLAAPGVEAPASAVHLGRLSGLRGGEQVALWLGTNGPLPTFVLPQGATEASFFFYSVGAVGPEIYARQRGGASQTPASERFVVPTTPAPELPGDPSLTLHESGDAEACDLTPGHHVVFFSSGTELAIGFAAIAVESHCHTLRAAEIPEGVGLLTAMQVNGEGVIGPPSNIVFP